MTLSNEFRNKNTTYRALPVKGLWVVELNPFLIQIDLNLVEVD